MKAPTTIARFRREVVDKCPDPRSILLAMRLLLFRLGEDCDFAQLADGKRLRDGLDFCAWLRELEAVLAIELEPLQFIHDERTALRRICHSCGHIHEDKQCGKDMGGAGVCKCDVEVSA